MAMEPAEMPILPKTVEVSANHWKLEWEISESICKSITVTYSVELHHIAKKLLHFITKVMELEETPMFLKIMADLDTNIILEIPATTSLGIHLGVIRRALSNIFRILWDTKRI